MIKAVSFSSETANKVAPLRSKDHIRGNIHVAGWSLEPVGNETKMTLIAEVDLHGNVPKSLLSIGNKDQGWGIIRLRDVAIPQYIKDHNIKL